MYSILSEDDFSSTDDCPIVNYAILRNMVK